VPVSAFAVFRPRNFRHCFFCVRRRRPGEAGVLLSAHGDYRRSRRDLQWQDLPRLLGVHVRRDVLPAVFDFAVAAPVMFTDGLQEPAPAADHQVKTRSPTAGLCEYRRGLSVGDELSAASCYGRLKHGAGRWP
jgi:hypothetical protein